MKKMNRLVLGLVGAFAAFGAAAGDYADSKVVREFSQRMAKEHGLDAAEVESLLAGAKKQQTILDAIARPAEKSKPWYEYRAIFLDEKRINNGAAFWRRHRETLERAEQRYGVAPEIVVAIIGVETRYGAVTGNHRVLDALATLGFDYPPRAAFFSRELEQFLLLAKEQKQDASVLKGSYAGAMGYGQFMPSSYRAYAVDFDSDDIADIWQNPVDAIGSVANYFKVHGWRAGQPVMIPAKARADYDRELINGIKRKPELDVEQLRRAGFVPRSADTSLPAAAIPLMFETQQGNDFWFGLNNFYVITRYNRSHMYARAVWELSQAIEQRYRADDIARTDNQ